MFHRARQLESMGGNRRKMPSSIWHSTWMDTLVLKITSLVTTRPVYIMQPIQEGILNYCISVYVLRVIIYESHGNWAGRSG